MNESSSIVNISSHLEWCFVLNHLPWFWFTRKWYNVCDEYYINEFPQIRDICIDDCITSDDKNYLSALSVALMISDICKNVCDEHISYAECFNKYVYEPFYNFPKIEDTDKIDKVYHLYDIKLNEHVCYTLRNTVLHAGTSYVE